METCSQATSQSLHWFRAGRMRDAHRAGLSTALRLRGLRLRRLQGNPGVTAGAPRRDNRGCWYEQPGEGRLVATTRAPTHLGARLLSKPCGSDSSREQRGTPGHICVRGKNRKSHAMMEQWATLWKDYRTDVFLVYLFSAKS